RLGNREREMSAQFSSPATGRFAAGDFRLSEIAKRFRRGGGDREAIGRGGAYPSSIRAAPFGTRFARSISPVYGGRKAFAFVAAVFLLLIATPAFAQAHWSIEVHGGAGVIERAHMDAQTEAQYRAAMNAALERGAAVL